MVIKQSEHFKRSYIEVESREKRSMYLAVGSVYTNVSTNSRSCHGRCPTSPGQLRKVRLLFLTREFHENTSSLYTLHCPALSTNRMSVFKEESLQRKLFPNRKKTALCTLCHLYNHGLYVTPFTLQCHISLFTHRLYPQL